MAFWKKKGDSGKQNDGAESMNEEAENTAGANAAGAEVEPTTNGDGARAAMGEELVVTANPDAESIELDEAQKLRAEVDEFKDKYLRVLAEFENYKKRALKDRSELLKYQGDRIFQDLLEVVDNFELALQYSESEFVKLKQGIELIHKGLLEVLSRWEVRSESAIGKDFDPFKHQALSKVSVADTKPGTVVSELKKAYFYKDKLIRVGQVVVAADQPTEPIETEKN